MVKELDKQKKRLELITELAVINAVYYICNEVVIESDNYEDGGRDSAYSHYNDFGHTAKYLVIKELAELEGMDVESLIKNAWEEANKRIQESLEDEAIEDDDTLLQEYLDWKKMQ